MLNPSTALKQARDGPRKLTAVEDEENESDRESVDPDMEDEQSSSSEDEQGGDSGDSSDEGDLGQYDPRARDASGKRPKNLNQAAELQRNRRGGRGAGGARLVDDDDDDDDASSSARRGNKKRSFEDRLKSQSSSSPASSRRPRAGDFMGDETPAGARSFTWTPSSSSRRDDDERKGKGGARKSAGDETFGYGLSKGAGAEEGKGVEGLSDEARFGRQKRRHPNRSASKNVIMRRT